MKNLPVATSRLRTVSHCGTVPTTADVQVVSADCRAAWVVEVGATAATFGATSRSDSNWASLVVSDVVGAPPRKPDVEVVCPGVTMIMFEPSALIWSVIARWAPSPSPTISITAEIPIRIPSMVSAVRSLRAPSASTAVRAVSRQSITDHLRPGRGRCRSTARHRCGRSVGRAPPHRARG